MTQTAKHTAHPPGEQADLAEVTEKEVLLEIFREVRFLRRMLLTVYLASFAIALLYGIILVVQARSEF